MKKYTVTKRFLTGVLKGIAVREETDVHFIEGRRYGGGLSSRYLVEQVEFND